MKFKKMIVVTLAFATFIACVKVSGEAVNAGLDSDQTPEISMFENNMKIGGTDTFGNMIAQEFAAKTGEQTENNGCNIFSLKWTLT